MRTPPLDSSRRRWAFVGLWAGLTVLGSALFLGGFELDNSVGIWFPQDDPALKQYEQFLETFGPWEWGLLLLEAEPGKDPRFPEQVEALRRALTGHEHIRQALTHPSGPGAAIAEESARRALLLETANPIHRGDDFRAALLSAIDGAVGEFPAITSHTLAGTSSINVALNRSARRDMLIFFNLVFLALVVLARVFLRAWRDVLVLVVIAVGTVAAMLGLVVLVGLRFNILTVMMPTVLIALCIADLVHLMHAFHARRGEGCDLAQARQLAVKEIRLPALGTSLTTIAGFLSLAPSSMPPVRHLAVFSALGIALAWIATVWVAPRMLELAWWKCPSSGAGQQPPLSLPQSWIDRLLGTGRGAFAVVALVAVLLPGLGQLRTDTNYREFFRSGSSVARSYNAIAAAGLAQSSIQIAVEVASDSPGLNSAQLLPFEDAVARLPEVKGMLSPGRSPTVAGLEAEAGRKLQLVVFTTFLGNEQLGDLVVRIEDCGRETLPAGSVTWVTGSPVLWERMDASIVATQRTSVLLVAMVTLALLIVLLRSVRAALLGWLASALPVAMILGLMGLLGVTLNLATVLIAGIALGLAVDDSIHLVFAHQRRRRHGDAPVVAARHALETVGPRLVVTSVVLAGSFACMALSDFLPTAHFGIFTALTIVLALGADLVLLPRALGGCPQMFTALFTGLRVRAARSLPGALEDE